MPEDRILVIVETSAAMQKRAENVQKVVGSVISGGLQGQMAPNSTIGIWTFNDKLFTCQLPLQLWTPASRQRVGTGAASLLHGDMKIQSLLWWPFHGGPDGFMVLVLNQVTHRRDWTDADLGFVEALGELVTLTLEKTERLTALHAAEQRATEASVRYRRLYDNTPSMFFTLDRGGVVRSTNRFACRSLGFSEDELIGAPVELVLHPDDVEAFRRQLSRCLERPSELATQEYRKRRKDGTEVWVRESMQAYRADDGDEVLVVCDDVTAEKRSTEALIRAQSLESIGRGGYAGSSG